MRVSCVQCNVAFGDAEANADRLINELTQSDADLLVFPEAFLTGYAVGDRPAAERIAIPHQHPAIRRIQAAVDATGRSVVFGFGEIEGNRLYNTAAFLLPSHPAAFYRKTHLPELGFDRFAEPGDALPVFETPFGKIGILICYDLRPPEAARTLALKGAELIVLPTNWPEGAETSANHICIARAAENRVFLATCNRAGSENGFRFIGQSKIIHPTGRLLESANHAETTLTAELSLAEARTKRTVNIPGVYELDLFGVRQPDLYREITAARPDRSGQPRG